MRTDIALQPSNNIPDNEEKRPDSGRRGFLKWVAGGAGALALAPELLKAAVLNERYLLFYNPNTGENIRQVYWTPREGYIREAVNEISWALRDHHNNQVKVFDPNVLDQLYALQLQLGLGRPINVISGYRSPSTNWRLCRAQQKAWRATAITCRPWRSIFECRVVGPGICVGRPVRWARAGWGTIPAPTSSTSTVVRCATGAERDRAVCGLAKRGRPWPPPLFSSRRRS